MGWPGRHVTPVHGQFRNPRHGFDRASRCGRFAIGCRDGRFLDLGWGYGGLIEDPEYAGRDMGFFSGPAEVVAADGGAYYDYDRAYPYDWYRDPAAAAAATPLMAAAPRVRCDVSWVSGSGGAREPVRVCRGRR